MNKASPAMSHTGALELGQTLELGRAHWEFDAILEADCCFGTLRVVPLLGGAKNFMYAEENPVGPSQPTNKQ